MSKVAYFGVRSILVWQTLGNIICNINSRSERQTNYKYAIFRRSKAYSLGRWGSSFRDQRCVPIIPPSRKCYGCELWNNGATFPGPATMDSRETCWATSSIKRFMEEVTKRRVKHSLMEPKMLKEIMDLYIIATSMEINASSMSLLLMVWVGY